MSAEYPPRDELKARREREKVTDGPLGTTDAVLAPVEPKGRKMSALALRLAHRMEVDPDELAASWPDDTLRRTKYPMIEEVQQDGSTLYKENVMRRDDG